MKYCVFGQDNRSKYLRKLYENVDVKEADVVILPIPYTRDNIYLGDMVTKIDSVLDKLNGKIVVTGNISEENIKIFDEKNNKVIDIMKYDEFKIKNAVATCEGSISRAVELTDFTLNSSNILILGYGRIGKILANMLHSYGANIFCEARKEGDIALIEAMGYNGIRLENIQANVSNMDIIFNTIPSCIIDESIIKRLKKDVCIIDIASNPGGVDYIAARENGIKVDWYLQIPSKTSPLSAARYIKETLDKIFKEGEIWEKKLM